MTQPNQVSVVSDSDYLKYIDGSITMTYGAGGTYTLYPYDSSPGGLSAGLTTITHNFGEVPITRVFWDPAKNGTWYNCQAVSGTALITPRIKTLSTTTTVDLILAADSPATNIPVYYRIYDIGSTALSSDDKVDKIFYKGSGSTTVPVRVSVSVAGSSTITIPHGQGEDILWTIQFSENGTDWYPEGVRLVGGPDTTSGPPGGPYARYFETTAYGYANSTNLNIVLQNSYTSTKLIYYRYTLDYKI